MSRQDKAVVLALWCVAWLALFVGGAMAQTPNPVTPGYQICNTSDPGNTHCSFQPVDLTHGLPVDVVGGGGGGSPTPGAGSQPYNYTPLSPGQYGLAIATSTALTIPTGALQALVCASGANVNFTYDGTTTPSASVGMPILIGQCFGFSGPLELANLKFIQQTATATLNVSYSK